MSTNDLLQAARDYLDLYDEWFVTVNAQPFDAQASAQAAIERDNAMERLREAAA